jgi:glycosyltransferase involved in cell wall biosynthesis
MLKTEIQGMDAARRESAASRERSGVGRLNILQTNFHLEWNGQVARVFLLSREMIQRGHRVVIAAPAGSALVARARAAGIPVFTGVRFKKNNRPISFFRDVVSLGRLARAEKFDCLHTHGSQDTWATVWARRLFRLPQPILMTRHNTKPVRFHFFNRWLYRHGIERLVIVSGAARENYRRFIAAGILAEKDISVIHSCIDLERFGQAPRPENIRAELGVGDDTPLIGLVGRMSRDKGHDILLEAVPQVLKKFPHAVFLLVGKEGKTIGPVVREIIRRRGLEKSVRLLGFREDTLDITAALDVSVLPAVGTDSSPAVLKEALYLGKPVVASRIAGLPEIVRGDAGILVAPGDAGELAQAIVATLRHGAKGRAPAREFPQQFTPGFMCDAYLRVYEEMRRRGRAADGMTGGSKPGSV